MQNDNWDLFELPCRNFRLHHHIYPYHDIKGLTDNELLKRMGLFLLLLYMNQSLLRVSLKCDKWFRKKHRPSQNSDLFQ